MTNFVYMKMKVGPINNSAFSSLSSSRLYSLPKYITKPFYKMCVFEVVWWNASHLLHHMHMLKSFATSIQNNYDGFVFIPSFSEYRPSLNRPLSLVLFKTSQTEAQAILQNHYYGKNVAKQNAYFELFYRILNPFYVLQTFYHSI